MRCARKRDFRGSSISEFLNAVSRIAAVHAVIAQRSPKSTSTAKSDELPPTSAVRGPIRPWGQPL